MNVILGTTPQERFGSFVTPALFRELGASTCDVADARYMPPFTYTSEEWFEFEKAAIFDRSWLCVGRVGLLQSPRDYFTITINDDPLVALRDDEGDIHVFSNVCRHRGMRLLDGSGSLDTDTIRCPLHSWTYGLDGRLKAAPEMQRTNFDRSSICMPELKVEVWQGFMFVNFDRDAAPLAPTLKKLEDEMQNYHLEQMVDLPPIDIPGYPWNWKVMLENFMEPYHNAYLHKGIHDFALGHSFVDHSPDENVIMHPTGFDRRDGAFNPIHQALLPPIETLTDEQRQRVMFAMIPPLMPLGLVPDHMFWFLVLPSGANSISLRIGISVPADSVRVQSFEKRIAWLVDGIMMYNDQDVVADTAVQRGLRSRFAPRGPHSWKETTVVQLNRWLYTRLHAYAEDAALVPS